MPEQELIHALSSWMQAQAVAAMQGQPPPPGHSFAPRFPPAVAAGVPMQGQPQHAQLHQQRLAGQVSQSAELHQRQQWDQRAVGAAGMAPNGLGGMGPGMMGNQMTPQQQVQWQQRMAQQMGQGLPPGQAQAMALQQMRAASGGQAPGLAAGVGGGMPAGGVMNGHLDGMGMQGAFAGQGMQGFVGQSTPAPMDARLHPQQAQNHLAANQPLAGRQTPLGLQINGVHRPPSAVGTAGFPGGHSEAQPGTSVPGTYPPVGAAVPQNAQEWHRQQQQRLQQEQLMRMQQSAGQMQQGARMGFPGHPPGVSQPAHLPNGGVMVNGGPSGPQRQPSFTMPAGGPQRPPSVNQTTGAQHPGLTMPIQATSAQAFRGIPGRPITPGGNVMSMAGQPPGVFAEQQGREMGFGDRQDGPSQHFEVVGQAQGGLTMQQRQQMAAAQQHQRALAAQQYQFQQAAQQRSASMPTAGMVAGQTPSQHPTPMPGRPPSVAPTPGSVHAQPPKAATPIHQAATPQAMVATPHSVNAGPTPQLPNGVLPGQGPPNRTFSEMPPPLAAGAPNDPVAGPSGSQGPSRQSTLQSVAGGPSSAPGPSILGGDGLPPFTPGVGLLRMYQFLDALASIGQQSDPLDYIHRMCSDFFSHSAIFRISLLDRSLGTSKAFELPVEVLPRFLHVMFDDGVQTLHGCLQSPRERMLYRNWRGGATDAEPQTGYTVEAQVCTLMMRYADGSQVHIPGQMTANFFLPSSAFDISPHELKLDTFEFSGAAPTELIARAAVRSEEVEHVLSSPPMPPPGSDSTPVSPELSKKARRLSQSKKKSMQVQVEEEAKRMVAEEEAKRPKSVVFSTTVVPRSTVGSLGFSERTLRCLEIIEGVMSLRDLMSFSSDHQLSPLESLRSYDPNLRPNGTNHAGVNGTPRNGQHAFAGAEPSGGGQHAQGGDGEDERVPKIQPPTAGPGHKKKPSLSAGLRSPGKPAPKRKATIDGEQDVGDLGDGGSGGQKSPSTNRPRRKKKPSQS